MSSFTSILLMYFPEKQAFEMLTSIISNNNLHSLFDKTLSKLNLILEIQIYIFKKNIPNIYKHMSYNKIEPSLYIYGWYLTLFTRFPIQLVLRIWDIFLFYGFPILLVSASSILKEHEILILESQEEQLIEVVNKIEGLSFNVERVIKNLKVFLKQLDMSEIRRKLGIDYYKGVNNSIDYYKGVNNSIDYYKGVNYVSNTIRSLLFITGISISLIFITLYIKEHRLLEIPFKLLIYVIVIGVLFISISVTGIIISTASSIRGEGNSNKDNSNKDTSNKDKDKDTKDKDTKDKNINTTHNTHVLNTLYVILSLTLLNILLINIIKHNKSISKIRGYASGRWNRLSERQKVFIQNRLECCGYSNSSDRVGGKGCVSSVGCGDRFVKIGESVKLAVQRIWVSFSHTSNTKDEVVEVI
ncbi:Rab-GTPase-TBC domain-containing protein [Hamiltosporidium tvaerminnensis]|uniref:Rab-GTPase-TBC domain-containing protein n=1 Tax=Hamiltosporidium tvaerminnensis TaxID=1176355 RepID=A0A4Q9LNV7_9MICR|nr:Rab-GTPase-TBC domain-containing protein [Hamiltosporidium tvaerminnensis]